MMEVRRCNLIHRASQGLLRRLQRVGRENQNLCKKRVGFVDDNIIAGLVGFGGGMAALVVQKFVERVVVRRMDQAETSRDLLIQLGSAIDGLEGFLEPLRLAQFRETEFPTKETLSKQFSGFAPTSPAVPLEKLLAAFRSPEVHRLLILYYGRFERFKSYNEEHRTAYYWILDADDSLWVSSWPKVFERLSTIAVSRQRMLTLCVRGRLKAREFGPLAGGGVKSAGGTKERRPGEQDRAFNDRDLVVRR